MSKKVGHPWFTSLRVVSESGICLPNPNGFIGSRNEICQNFVLLFICSLNAVRVLAIMACWVLQDEMDCLE